MTTITVTASNFNALKIAGYLTKEGVQYQAKESKPVYKPTLTDILQAVCKYHKISPELIKTKIRKRELVNARQQFMYIAYVVYRGFSLHTIGGYINCHHSSIIHGRNVVNEQLHGKLKHIETNQKVAQDIENILSLLA